MDVDGVAVDGAVDVVDIDGVAVGGTVDVVVDGRGQLCLHLDIPHCLNCLLLIDCASICCQESWPPWW